MFENKTRICGRNGKRERIQEKICWCTLVFGITQRGIFIYIGLIIPLSTWDHLPTVLFCPCLFGFSLCSSTLPHSSLLEHNYRRALILIMWLSPAVLLCTKLSLYTCGTYTWKKTLGFSSVTTVNMLLERLLDEPQVRTTMYLTCIPWNYGLQLC